MPSPGIFNALTSGAEAGRRRRREALQQGLSERRMALAESGQNFTHGAMMDRLGERRRESVGRTATGALGNVSALERMFPGVASSRVAKLRQMAAGAGDTGELDPSFYGELGSATGEYGGAMQKRYQDQLRLAGARHAPGLGVNDRIKLKIADILRDRANKGFPSSGMMPFVGDKEMTPDEYFGTFDRRSGEAMKGVEALSPRPRMTPARQAPATSEGPSDDAVRRRYQFHLGRFGDPDKAKQAVEDEISTGAFPAE